MKRFVVVVLNLFFCLGSAQWAVVQSAEQFPNKPITCIVAVEAGADGDVVNRQLMQNLSQVLGQPIMVVNKPGAGSAIGYRELHNAKPDGYTIGWASATIVTNRLQGISPIDYHDYTQLGAYATFFPILVASTMTQRNFKTVQEVISYARAHPGEVSMAIAGIGHSWWVAAMSFLNGTGLEINGIPQAGGGAMVINQVAGGHTDLGIGALGSAKGMIGNGRLRFLASLGDERAPAPYDQFPTVKELGYEVSWESTNMVLGPPKMPQGVVDILVKGIEKVSHDPNFIKFCIRTDARWGYIPPDKVVPVMDKRRMAVREIMSKAGILKEAK